MTGVWTRVNTLSRKAVKIRERGIYPLTSGTPSVNHSVMSLITSLISVADAFCLARTIVRATLSSTMLADHRVLDRVARGGSMTTRNYERAMQWMSDRWPDGAIWPADVPRPEPTKSDLEVC